MTDTRQFNCYLVRLVISILEEAAPFRSFRRRRHLRHRLLRLGDRLGASGRVALARLGSDRAVVIGRALGLAVHRLPRLAGHPLALTAVALRFVLHAERRCKITAASENLLPHWRT